MTKNNSGIDFITLCAQGMCELSEIDDFIDAWHCSSHPLPLHTFLGFSLEDYNIWLLRPDFLQAVVIDKQKVLGLIKN